MTVGQLRQQGDFGVAGLGDDERAAIAMISSGS